MHRKQGLRAVLLSFVLWGTVSCGNSTPEYPYYGYVSLHPPPPQWGDFSLQTQFYIPAKHPVACLVEMWEIYLFPLELHVTSKGQALNISINAQNVEDVLAREYELAGLKIRMKYEYKGRKYHYMTSYLEILSREPVARLGFSWTSPIFGSHESTEKQYPLWKRE